LAYAAWTQLQVNLAGAEQLTAAVQWADLHVVLDSSRSRVPGGESLVQPGGDGTPKVAEFCVAELGAAIGVSASSAGSLMADALDLRHRLPRLWRRVLTGAVKPWIARKVAAKSRQLTQQAADRLDRRVFDIADTTPYGRLLKVVDAEILKADPEQAKVDTHAAAAQQGVWVSRDDDHGYATLVGKAPAPDLHAVDVSLDEIAKAMAALGDTDSHDLRRAKALALLANPEAVLDLVRRANEEMAAGTPRRPCDLGKAVLHVHLTDAILTTMDGDGAGVARVEDVGPALLTQVRDWLGHRQVTLRPVIDIRGIQPVDCYEVPDRMAEAIRLRTPASCFPFSNNTSRSGDNDHTIEYVDRDDGGPPGQTRPSNLGRMSRFEHRVKTFSRWKVTQPRSGVWVWRSPNGYFYLVDDAGTTALGTLLT
jgi:hypothetical protein